MKLNRIICAAVTFFAIVTCASVNVNAKVEENDNFHSSSRLRKNDNISEKTEKKQSYLEPIYDDFEDENDIPMLYSSDAQEDMYENNDSFSAANCISPSFNGDMLPISFDKNINASLHRNEWLWGLWKREIDEDYYKVEIYGKAHISISLSNIPSECDYDLEFYQFDNIKYCDEKDISLISSSTRGSNINEAISTDVLPNVFYIRIYSYSGFDAQNYYSLNIDVDYSYKDESISEMRYSKNAGAAIWVSDFDPFGIEPFSSSSSQEIGYFTSSEYYSAYRIAHPYTSILRSNDNMLHASLFIWDKDIRIAIYKTVQELISITEKEVNKNETIRFSWETGSNIVNGSSVLGSITLTILSATNVPIAAATITGLSLFATLAPGCFDAIMEAIIPTSKIEIQKDYLVYLRVLSAALECDSNTSENEVIRINSRYKIVVQSVPLIVQMNYDIDFTPSIQSSYLYSNNIIRAYQEDAFFSGTIYPLQSLNDLVNARKKNQFVLEEVNTGGNTQISVNQSLPASLNDGQYYWYNFTAPENGVYKFFTEGTTDTYGEIFESIVPGRQTKGRIDYHDDIDLYSGNTNFCIEYPMYKGNTIYIRVHGFSWSSQGLYSFRTERTSDINFTEEKISKTIFGFRGEYVDYPENTVLTLDSGFTFTTKRLRCGYIENSYLTLSAKCKDAGVAYLEFNYNRAIHFLNFDMGIWGDDERLNTNSSITLEVKNANGNWSVFNTFNINLLSKNKDLLDSFNFDFNHDVYGTRIKVTTNAVTSTKNKGRVVLDNFTLGY